MKTYYIKALSNDNKKQLHIPVGTDKANLELDGLVLVQLDTAKGQTHVTDGMGIYKLYVTGKATETRPPQVRMACRDCGSFDVSVDAFAQWDFAAQDWALSGLLDETTCELCGCDVPVVAVLAVTDYDVTC